MLTRRKQNNTNSNWQPFATSTPMRIIPDKTKTDGLPQKQFTKCKDAKVLPLHKTFKTLHNGQSKQVPEQNGKTAKKFKRNRSNFYFDMSSSSSSEDEDSHLSSNGPTIKISLESSTNIKSNLKNGDHKRKILVSPKNNIIESNKIIVDNGVNAKSANKKGFVVTDLLNKEINANNTATENGKSHDEVTSAPQKLNFGMKLPCRSKNSSNEYEDKDKENILNKKKNNSQNKSNNSSRNSASKHKTDLNGCESNSYTESSILDLAPTLEHGKPSQQQNVYLKSKKNVNNKSQNSPELVKDVSNERKRPKPMSNADPIERKRVKNEERLSADNKSPTDQKKPKLKLKSYRKDLSHQLFSDSMHEELINSLDLTNAELDNVEKVFESPWKLTPNKTLPKKSKVKGKAVRNINFSPKKSMRHREPPKEFWMPRNQCDLNKVTGDSKEEDSSGKGDAVSASKCPNFNEVPNEKGHVLKKAEKVNAECIKAITKNVKTISKTKKLEIRQNFPNKKSAEDENQVHDDDNKENKAKVDKDNLRKLPSLPTNFSNVFKHLPTFDDYDDETDGVQAAECWSLKNFKCGVLKVHSKHHISDKTSFENSYFGGILIKGSLKMRIGSKDLVINQGDMAFVPPLTEWCVVSNHESESLFYYWCGRFKS